MNWKIKTRKNTLAFSALILLAISCGSMGNKGKESNLSGTITGATGSESELILQKLLPTEVINMDTAVIDEQGKFAFYNANIEEIGFYRVKQSDRNFITLVLEPKDKVVLNSEWPLGASKYSVEGSKESQRLQELNKQMTAFYMAQDSLNQVYQSNQNNQEVVLNLQMVFNELAKENGDFARAFIKEDPSSFACLAAAEQLDPERDAEIFKMIDAELGKKHSESVYYNEFHKMVVKIGMLAIGTEAPDIILPNTMGETVKLSDFKGKVVLVDFWASWCRPCRAENPNVVRAYEKYKDKGFEVFGVSLDQSRDKWVEAIAADNLHWTQVSDLKLWNSSVVKLYDIKGIPFAVLLDREGKIIAKNLRGPALEEKLEEILN